MNFQLSPIGVIHSPFVKASGTPIQTIYAEDAQGTVEVFEPFIEGLADIEGFDRVWLLYWCDRASSPQMRVVPYRDTQRRGLFATRAPARPNPIGLSPVSLIRVERNVLHVKGIDILDETPLLDIKPYVPEFDSFADVRSGWLGGRHAGREHSDERFHNNKGAHHEA
jgi:tRNA-Thr(GGU) m(6)t(6)A37 methyltransferase TsaA